MKQYHVCFERSGVMLVAANTPEEAEEEAINLLYHGQPMEEDTDWIMIDDTVEV